MRVIIPLLKDGVEVDRTKTLFAFVEFANIRSVPYVCKVMHGTLLYGMVCYIILYLSEYIFIYTAVIFIIFVHNL